MPNRAEPFRWALAPFGAFGAALPAIVSLAQKTEAFTFAVRTESAVAMAIYMTAAAIIAAIFPYKAQATRFTATLVGILLPSIVGGALSIAKLTLPISLPDSMRGGEAGASTVGRWIDAFSLL